MTPSDFRSRLKAFGLRFKERITDKTDAYINRENNIIPLANPDSLTEEQREAVIKIYKITHGITE